MEDTSYNPYMMAQKQFDNAAELLELDQATRDFLRVPMREYQFSIPVRMDDGQVQDLPWIQGITQRCQGSRKRWDPVPSPGNDRYRPGLIHVDDLEMRCRGYPPWRRKRRGDL